MGTSKDLESKLEKWINRLIWICGILIVLGITVGIYGICSFDMTIDKGIESFGNYASGTVAAFWSLAGVVLILIAFLGQRLELQYQKEELKLNREELEETRKVLTEQKNEFELQNKTLSRQTFENLFFQMLRNYVDIVYHMDIGDGSLKKSGRDCFSPMYHKFRSRFDALKTIDNEEERIDTAYIEFFKEFQNDLGNYFRNLYNIFKFINNSNIKHKRLYSNIVRAQLSTFELGLLYYNCISRYGRLKFKPLIEEFNILKNIPKNILIKPEHVDFYPKTVFEEDEWVK